MSVEVTVGVLAAIPPTIVALGGLYKAHLNGKVAAETKAIATQTRDMADGRLTAVTQKVDDLTGKLQASEQNVSRLVGEKVAQASSDVLVKAQLTAAELLQQAKNDAATLLAEAANRAPKHRR